MSKTSQRKSTVYVQGINDGMKQSKRKKFDKKSKLKKFYNLGYKLGAVGLKKQISTIPLDETVDL